jgi:hypothetical protein
MGSCHTLSKITVKLKTMGTHLMREKWMVAHGCVALSGQANGV